MASHNTLIRNKEWLQWRFCAGFTMFEVLLVMVIMMLLLGLGIFMSIDAYRGYLSHSDQNILVSILSRARSHALTNYYSSPWGVCYDDTAKDYVLFRGDSFADAITKETTAANPTVVVISLPAGFLCSSGGVVFSQLTGTTTAVIITETQGARVETTSINYEGTISW